MGLAPQLAKNFAWVDDHWAGLLILVSPDVFSGVRMDTNALAAGALSRTHLRELTVLPRPPSWTKGRGKRRIGRKGKRKPSIKAFTFTPK